MTTLTANLGGVRFPRTNYDESPEHVITTITEAHEREGLRVHSQAVARNIYELTVMLADGRRVARYRIRGS